MNEQASQFVESAIATAVLHRPVPTLTALQSAGLDASAFEQALPQAIIQTAFLLSIEGATIEPTAIQARLQPLFAAGIISDQDFLALRTADAPSAPDTLSSLLLDLQRLLIDRRIRLLFAQYDAATATNKRLVSEYAPALLQAIQSVLRNQQTESPRFIDHLSRWARFPRGGIRTGLPILDEWLGGGLAPGRTTVFGAPTAHGKTTMAITLTVAAVLQNAQVCYFSSEMDPAVLGMMMVRALLALRRITLPREQIAYYAQLWQHDPLDAEIPSPVREAYAQIENHVHFYANQLTAEDIVFRGQNHTQTPGSRVALWVIDHFHRLEHRAPHRTANSNLIFGRSAQILDDAARRCSVNLVLFAQLSQAAEREWYLRRRVEGIPFKESGEIANVAFHAFIFGRTREQNQTRIFLKKDRELGRQGFADIDYWPLGGIYVPLLSQEHSDLTSDASSEPDPTIAPAYHDPA